MGRYCSYLLPKQTRGTTQNFIIKTLRMIGRPRCVKLKNRNMNTTEIPVMHGEEKICGSSREGTSSVGGKGGKVGEMRYVTKLRDSELSIRWIDRREEDLLNMIGKTILSDLLYFLPLTCNVKIGGHEV